MISVSRLEFVILRDRVDLKRRLDVKSSNARLSCFGAKSVHFLGFSKKFSGEPGRTFSVILEMDYIGSQKGIYYQYRSPDEGVVFVAAEFHACLIEVE